MMISSFSPKDDDDGCLSWSDKQVVQGRIVRHRMLICSIMDIIPVQSCHHAVVMSKALRKSSVQ